MGETDIFLTGDSLNINKSNFHKLLLAEVRNIENNVCRLYS